MATSKINTPTKRERLKPRNEPYWEKLSQGRFLGYYRGAGDSGAWIARMDGTRTVVKGKSVIPRRREKLATNETSYEDALKLAAKWCDAEEKGGNTKNTLDDCITDYCKHLRANNSAKAAKHTGTRLRKHLPDAMLQTEIRKLTKPQVRNWHASMIRFNDDPDDNGETERKSKDSANRVLTMLKAALNIAYGDDVITSSKAWEVKAFKSVSSARIVFLTDDEINALLNSTVGGFNVLLRALIHTGARYMEIGNAKARDLSGGTLTLSGKTGKRTVELSKEAEKFFLKQAGDKNGKEPLLTSPNGGQWVTHQQIRPMKAAVKAAKLPSDAVIYSLRHYHISKAVGAGLPLLAIAKNCGTSVKMIEKHYGHFRPDDVGRMMDSVELGL